MAHADGFTKKDARGVLAEAGRELNKYKNYVDVNRTTENYQMQGGSSREVLARAQARANDIMQGKKMQKQSHLVVSWAIHYPKCFCHEETVMLQEVNEETGEIKDVERTIYVPDDKEHCKKFMQMMYEEAQQRYGVENVVEGYVHMDETTPHMTVICVPEAVSRKTHERTVSSASKMLKRSELKTFQTILDKRCEKEYGVKNLILNGKTKSNLTIDELKARQAQEKDIAEREENIISREHALDDTSVSLKQRRKNIALKESKLDARELKLDKRDTSITEREKTHIKNVMALRDEKAEFEQEKQKTEHEQKLKQQALEARELALNLREAEIIKREQEEAEKEEKNNTLINNGRLYAQQRANSQTTVAYKDEQERQNQQKRRNRDLPDISGMDLF